MATGRAPGSTPVFRADRGKRLKAPGRRCCCRHDLSTLRAVYLAERAPGRADRAVDFLGRKPIIDNYWQTESGWPILSAQPGVERVPTRFGSPSFPVYGFDARIVSESTGEDLGPDEKGVVAIVPPCRQAPCPPSGATTSASCRRTSPRFPAGRCIHVRLGLPVDPDGYWFILGRTDDAGSTSRDTGWARARSKSRSTAMGVGRVRSGWRGRYVEGQVAMAFAELKDPAGAETRDGALALEGDIMRVVEDQLGAVARPARIRFVSALPRRVPARCCAADRGCGMRAATRVI